MAVVDDANQNGLNAAQTLQSSSDRRRTASPFILLEKLLIDLECT